MSLGRPFAPGYRLLRLLRRGGAVDVYDAWSEERECRCVVKTLRPARRRDRAARSALLREGTLLLGLSHPHLVRAYEILRRPPALILETLTGKTLGRIVDESPKGIGEASVVMLGLQLCSALSYLHRHGVLHLDLKPSNVVADNGTAKLLDLSVARPPGRPHQGLGTPGYMSPEQKEGTPLTPAADVWGLGVVLFEAASGKRALSEGVRSPPPIRQRSRIDRELADTIDACLELDPSRRPALADVAAALRSLV